MIHTKFEDYMKSRTSTAVRESNHFQSNDFPSSGEVLEQLKKYVPALFNLDLRGSVVSWNEEEGVIQFASEAGDKKVTFAFTAKTKFASYPDLRPGFTTTTDNNGSVQQYEDEPKPLSVLTSVGHGLSVYITEKLK